MKVYPKGIIYIYTMQNLDVIASKLDELLPLVNYGTLLYTLVHSGALRYTLVHFCTHLYNLVLSSTLW